MFKVFVLFLPSILAAIIFMAIMLVCVWIGRKYRRSMERKRIKEIRLLTKFRDALEFSHKHGPSLGVVRKLCMLACNIEECHRAYGLLDRRYSAEEQVVLEGELFTKWDRLSLIAVEAVCNDRSRVFACLANIRPRSVAYRKALECLVGTARTFDEYLAMHDLCYGYPDLAAQAREKLQSLGVRQQDRDALEFLNQEISFL
jgi:hypothetical protein